MSSPVASTKYYSVTETAILVRQSLKLAFPGVKFSVRSSSYSGGASIDINWVDGPTTKQVDVVAKRFEGATFDGMIDLKEYQRHTEVTPDGSMVTVHYGSDYVFTSRRKSMTLVEKAIVAYRAKYGDPPFEVRIMKYSDDDVSVSLIWDSTKGKSYDDYHFYESALNRTIGEQVG